MKDNEEFKANILRSYELRPEAYYLQFRGGRKRVGESHKDCAHYLAQAFRRWIASEQVESRDDLDSRG